MPYRLRVQPEMKAILKKLERDNSKKGLLKQLRKVLGYLELNPRHPSLNTHEYVTLTAPDGGKVFEAYAQNHTPGAYRVFWHYGPNEEEDGKRIPVLTILSAAPHD